jgi:signal peptidase I
MTEEVARKRRPSRASATRWTILSVLVIAWAVVYTLWHPSPWEAAGPSMLPAVPEGDRFITMVLAPRLGDVAIVVSPADGSTILKRIVGVPGDTVEIRDGDLWRNGRRVTGTTWRPATGPDASGRECASERLGAARYSVMRTGATFAQDSTLPVHVTSGHVYVLGDQRDRSNDSRFFGQVRMDRVLGRSVWTYWHAERRVHCP